MVAAILLISFTGCQEKDHLIFNQDQVIPVSLNDVVLLSGPFLDARNRDMAYLKSLDPDRLVASFRQTAGLPSKADNYKGWESSELRGHFTGHYLSASSMMFAATGDTALKDNVEYLVKELRICQEKNGGGYISAFPIEFIDRVEAGKPVWAPYYTIHKILAGLVDSYTLCGDTLALQIACDLADWIKKRCDSLTREQMQFMLEKTEQGGMNEVLYRLWALTSKVKYKELAEKFYEDAYFIPLSKFRDQLKGQHVNSFIPNVIGLALGYELTGDPKMKQITEFFWKTVTESRSFVTGGTSNGEIWGSDNYHMHSELGPSSHETCCTYNMLKLTRYLWLRNQDPAFSDFYERALWNGILPTQHPVTGMTMYYVPMAPGYYKTFGTPENSFWCCTGTGIENFAKTGGCIYFVGRNKVYVDQYIASEMTVDSAGFGLNMTTGFPESESIQLEFTIERPSEFELYLRIPGWIADNPEISLNGKKLECSAGPSSYFILDRKWRTGDVVRMRLPMDLYFECLPDSPDTCAILYGPVVLAGKLGNSDLTDKKQYGHYGPYNDQPVAVPDLKRNGSPEKTILKAGNEKLLFKTVCFNGDSVEMIPFYRLFDERYTIYWSFRR